MYSARIRTAAAAMLVSLTLAAAGCTTSRIVSVPRGGSEPLSSRIKPGNRLILRLRSGETLNFQVTAVEPDAVISRKTRIAFEDIEKIQRIQSTISVRRSVGLVGAGVVIGFALWVHHLSTRDGNE